MKAPPHLYKYFTASGALRFLQAWRLRFTPPDVFNDPFELRPFIRLSPNSARKRYEQTFEKHVQELFDQAPHLAAAGLSYHAFRAFAETQRDMVGNEFEALIPFVEGVIRESMPAMWAENIGVLCLTEEPANLLMWAHYADSHQGVCIGFNANASCFNRRRSSEDEFGYLRRVTYAHVRPEIELTSCEDPMRDFLTKSNDWSYEREWRIMMPLESSDKIMEGSPRPIALFNCPPDVVTKVILGARAAPEFATEVASVLASEPKANSIEVWNAILSERHYRIDLQSSAKATSIYFD